MLTVYVIIQVLKQQIQRLLLGVLKSLQKKKNKQIILRTSTITEAFESQLTWQFIYKHY